MKVKICEKCGLIYKNSCLNCDPLKKPIEKIEDELEKKEKELKETYLSARSKLLDITGNSIKVMKALTNLEEASNALYKHINLK